MSNLAPTAPSPTDATTVAQNENTVIVYYNGTFVHLRNGAHARMSSLLRFLVSKGYAVTLYSFENHYDEPWDDAARAKFAATYPTVRLVLDRRSRALDRLASLKNALTALFPKHAPAILAWRLDGETPNFDALLAEQPRTPWIVNYPDAFTQLNGLPSAAITVETHDIKFIAKAKRDQAPPSSFGSLLRMRSELAVLGQATGVLALSPVEAGFYRAMLAAPEVFYVAAYGVDPRPLLGERPASGYTFDLLFVGSEMWQNSRGLLDFFDRHGAWARNYRIGIAGKVGRDASISALARKFENLRILGFVDDLAALYASSKAAFSPVDGTGMKIKAVEALSHGLPVFGSQHTLDGLAPGKECCVFPIDAASVAAVLDDPMRLESARTAARDYWSRMAEASDVAAFDRYLSRQVEAIKSR